MVKDVGLFVLQSGGVPGAGIILSSIHTSEFAFPTHRHLHLLDDSAWDGASRQSSYIDLEHVAMLNFWNLGNPLVMCHSHPYVHNV